MAKMFYTLEETAQKLGIGEDQVKSMAAGGKLQQFRDRDKLMFKRDQVDSMAKPGAGRSSEPGLGGSGGSGGSGGPIPLASGDTDAIDLKADTKGPTGRREDPRQATGISVFEAGEVETADPMAQTQVTSAVSDQEDLALESVGSGSGLLDLTRESDDTSLGAELLDEIYPGGGEGSDAKVSVPTSSPAFDSGVMTAESSSSGLENLGPVPGGAAVPAAVAYTAAEPYDGAGSGLGVGLLLGAMIAIVLALIVAVPAVTGAPSGLATSMTGDPNTVLIVAAALLVGTLIFGVIGYFVGKSAKA